MHVLSQYESISYCYMYVLVCIRTFEDKYLDDLFFYTSIVLMSEIIYGR